MLVEKPVSYNMFEAQQIVAATRKYNRIVPERHRGAAAVAPRSAARTIREGIIGDVYMARGLVFKWRDTIGARRKNMRPAGRLIRSLDRSGAGQAVHEESHFHYNWHWQWDYGNGDIGNQGAHQIHSARTALGVKYPTKISSMGGHYMFDDDQETPNTQLVTFEFEDGGKKKLLAFEVRHWISNNEAGIGERSAPTGGGTGEPLQTVGNIWYGSKGYLATTRDGWQTFMGPEQAPGPKSEADPGIPGSRTSSTSCAAGNARISWRRSKRARSRPC